MSRTTTAIQRAVIDMLDAASAIISKDREIVSAMFRYLIEGLNTKQLQTSSMKLIVKMVNENRSFIVDNNLFEDVIARIICINSVVYEIGIEHMMNSDCSQDLLSVCTQIICESKDPSAIKAHLEKMIAPLLHSTAKALSTPAASNTPTTSQSLLSLVSVFSNIESLKVCAENPLLDVFSEVFDVLVEVMEKSVAASAVECVGTIVKNFMRCAEAGFLPRLGVFVEAVERNYKRTALSSYLYYAEFTISVYGSNKELFKLLLSMVDTLGKFALELIEKRNDRTCVADFFGMCLRCLEVSPTLFFESEITDKTLELSANMLNNGGTEYTKPLCMFLCQLFKYYSNKDLSLDGKRLEVWNYLINKAAGILKKTVFILASGPDEKQHLIDLFIQMFESLPVNNMRHFLDAIQSVPSLHHCE